MRHLLTPVGLSCVLVFIAGNVWGQQAPATVKPAAIVAQESYRLATDAQAPLLFYQDPCFYINQRPIYGPYGQCGPYGQRGPYGSMYDGACSAWPQPIFRGPCYPNYEVERVNSLVARATNLGNVGIDTAKIAAVLDRGIPERLGNSPSVARKNDSGAKIQLASFEPELVAQNGKENPAPSPEAKQLTDSINQIFKMQADLIRSLDVGSMRPAVAGIRPAALGVMAQPITPLPGACANGACNGDSCAMILTGRSGLELTRMVPQVHDVLNLPRTQGLFIKEVYPKTPADLAGYKKNDILIEMDGKKVPAGYFDFLSQIFQYVKNDTPIHGVVLRAGQRVEITGMKITDRRVVPPLPNECPLDAVIPQLNVIAPGINTSQVNLYRAREMRTVVRPNGITEIIWVDR